MNVIKILQMQFRLEAIDVNTYMLGQQTLSIGDFGKVCRTCLKESDIKPIFNSEYQDRDILQILQSCASIQVSFV